MSWQKVPEPISPWQPKRCYHDDDLCTFAGRTWRARHGSYMSEPGDPEYPNWEMVEPVPPPPPVPRVDPKAVKAARRAEIDKAIVESFDMFLERFSPMAKALMDRVGALEKKIAAVEAAKSFNLADVYRDTYRPDQSYARGCVITHGGSAWLCLVDTSARPGESGDWKLFVKKGARPREPA